MARKGLAQKKQQESLGQAALAHSGKYRKEALGIGSGDKSGTSCQLPIALEFRRLMPVKKGIGRGGGVAGERKGNGSSSSPQRGHTHAGAFVLRLLSLFHRWESQGRSQGRISVEQPSVLQVCSFRVMVSSDWLESGQSLQLVLPSLTWVCCFSGPAAETQLRPRCHLQGCDLCIWLLIAWILCSAISVSLFHLLRNFQLLTILSQSC